MSNPNSPFGFKPMRDTNGAAWNAQTNPYNILAGASPYATSIFRFDIVKLINSGLINLAAAGDQPRGIFMGVTYIDTTGRPQKSAYWPGATAVLSGSVIVCDIIDDPNVTMQVQLANSSTVAAQTNQGELVNLFAGAGTTGTGQSTMGADFSSTATSGRTFRLLRPIPAPDNDTSASNQRWEVSFATHDFKVVTGI